MGEIVVLPENLINQIAAGEVVERPASVVKELVENAVDAGADRIVVEAKEGGCKMILVRDNGKGIRKDDLEMSILRHATSKIKMENDLWKIKTMGFRGEALASIASVARLSLKSKREDEISGHELFCEGGEKIQLKEVSMNTGTEVKVEELFFNTPARRRYLKQVSTELKHITAFLNTFALSNIRISLKFIHNGKTVIDLNKVTDLKSRVRDIFGAVTAEAMLPIYYGGSDFQVDGFIGKPAISRSSSNYQYFFVNGRPINNYVLANSVKSAYHSMLMENKKPVFIINITIDPALVDVNVHPRKIEVRFDDQQSLMKTIYSATKTALEKHNLSPLGFSESKRYMSDSFPETRGGRNLGRGALDRGRFVSGGKVQEAMNFNREFSSREFSERAHSDIEGGNERGNMRAISQVANSYIIAEKEQELVLVDQHAAHERVRYEQLMDQYENQQKSKQSLLMPLQMDFSSDEEILLKDSLTVYKELGFEIEHFGGNSYVIQAVPLFLANEDIDFVVKGVLDDLESEKKPGNIQGKKEEIINYMACRSEIKFGQKLNLVEMQELLDQLEKLKRPYTCPHGRPTMVTLTLDELHKMFGRK